MSEAVAVEITGAKAIVRVTGDRPENFWTMDALAGLRDAVTALATDPKIVAIVLAGADRNFCGGLAARDAYELYGSARIPTQRDRLGAHALFWGHDGLVQRWQRCPKVTVVAAEGLCRDIGLSLALASDLVVVSETTSASFRRWVFTGVDGDLTPVALTVGLRRAKELCLTGRELDGATCHEWGVADRLVAAGEAAAAATSLADEVAISTRDGIAFGKAHFAAASDAVQGSTGQSFAVLLGAVASNVHYRAGEFNFYKAARDLGVEEAERLAEAHLESWREHAHA